MTRNLCLLLTILSTAACGIELDVDGDLSDRDPCASMCAAQAAAGCAGFSADSCRRACRALYDAAPRCGAQLDAVTRCAARSAYTCSNGRPTIQTCRAEADTAGRCIDDARR